MANDMNADALISIHGNTYPDPAVSGTESYYYSEDSFPLAHDVHEQLVKATGFRDRGVKQDNWKVLRECKVPAILLEVGFLTNPENETTLLNDDRQNEIAHAIVDGIKNYFNEGHYKG
ncbi:N-acetylmuramoyl-L-alanine amidase LytC precursor [compost metagenome]